MPYKRGNKWVAQVKQGESRIHKVFLSKDKALAWEADQRRRPADQWKKRRKLSILEKISLKDKGRVLEFKKTEQG